MFLLSTDTLVFLHPSPSPYNPLLSFLKVLRESIMPSFPQPKCPHNADTDLDGVVVSEKQEGGDLTSITHLNVLILVDVVADSCQRTNFAYLQSRPLYTVKGNRNPPRPTEPPRRQPLLFKELRGHCFMEGDMRTMSTLAGPNDNHVST